MFNSTYGAGFRAGMAHPTFAPQPNGTKVIITPKCPFPAYRFISYALWHEGQHAGTLRRLSGKDQPLPWILRIDWLGIALFVCLFIFFKVM